MPSIPFGYTSLESGLNCTLILFRLTFEGVCDTIVVTCSKPRWLPEFGHLFDVKMNNQAV